MVFSSVAFLFVFLPLIFLCYFCATRPLRNTVLLTGSLLFYLWGSGNLFFLIIISILIDYCCGLIQSRSSRLTMRRACVAVSVAANLSLLAYFKYYNFFVANINEALELVGWQTFSQLQLALPIGISFYTFQTISYQIDLYRGVVRPQRNIINFSLFVALFPQLIAGPIVRYQEIEAAIDKRSTKLAQATEGITRFIFGLAKKVLIADSLGIFVDYVFSRPETALPGTLAWLGAGAFTLQVYFDFAAYSDMAIGLGQIFGFRFPENFRYPFTARSVREFWQRWHMTLTRWFRDYLYKPLRDRPGGRRWRDSLTLLVFLLVGLWHGASWTFILWGLYHGVFLVLERKFLGRILARRSLLLQHIYLLLVVVFSAILFRAESLAQAGSFYRAMLGFNSAAEFDALFYLHWNRELFWWLAVAIAVSTPLPLRLWQAVLALGQQHYQGLSYRRALPLVAQTGAFLLLLSLLLLATGAAIANTTNPFIYFQF